MDQEIMEGIILSYTKILKEIKEIHLKIDQLSRNDDKCTKKKPKAYQDLMLTENQGSNNVKDVRKKKYNRKTVENSILSASKETGIVLNDFFKNLEDSM